MQAIPIQSKKFLYALAFLALIVTAANPLEIAYAATIDRQTSSITTAASIYSPRLNQPNNITVDTSAASVLNTKQQQMQPNPTPSPSTVTVESYVFKPQPNGTITASKSSNGAIYLSTDLGILLNLMPKNANVALKAGTYNMHSQYNPKDGQHIIGESQGEVKIVGYKTKTDYALILGSASNLELANITFNVNNPNPQAKQTPNCGLGILLLGSSNRLHDLTVYNAYLQGIVMGFYGSSAPSSGNMVENCEVYNCGNDGIVLDACTSSQVRNCYIHDSYGPVAGGVNVAYGSRNCIVRDCVAINTAYGFATDNSLGAPEESISFLHNTVNAPYINGFMVDGGINIVFKDNTVTGYAQYGFVSIANPLNGATSTAVSYYGNFATDAKSVNGIGFFLTQGNDFVFIGNKAMGNLVGLQIQSMKGKTQIESCIFSGNTAHDIMVVYNPAYTTINNCRMHSTAPIWVDQASAQYTTIKNST